MQVENDYDKEVYNGDLGVVSRIDMEAVPRDPAAGHV
jgi:ATP-dependent exoDNAse (exonuclease V) alpha subunit